jgi:hypothetical protein
MRWVLALLFIHFVVSQELPLFLTAKNTVNFAVIYGGYTVILRATIVNLTALTCAARALTCKREFPIRSLFDEVICYALECGEYRINFRQ